MAPALGSEQPGCRQLSPRAEEWRQGRTAAPSPEKKQAEAPLPSREIVEDLELEEIEQEPDGGGGPWGAMAAA